MLVKGTKCVKDQRIQLETPNYFLSNIGASNFSLFQKKKRTFCKLPKHNGKTKQKKQRIKLIFLGRFYSFYLLKQLF
jgi:hypothetical protein